jgi:hypothetical protein
VPSRPPTAILPLPAHRAGHRVPGAGCPLGVAWRGGGWGVRAKAEYPRNDRVSAQAPERHQRAHKWSQAINGNYSSFAWYPGSSVSSGSSPPIPQATLTRSYCHCGESHRAPRPGHGARYPLNGGWDERVRAVRGEDACRQPPTRPLPSPLR